MSRYYDLFLTWDSKKDGFENCIMFSLILICITYGCIVNFLSLTSLQNVQQYSKRKQRKKKKIDCHVCKHNKKFMYESF